MTDAELLECLSTAMNAYVLAVDACIEQGVRNFEPIADAFQQHADASARMHWHVCPHDKPVKQRTPLTVFEGM